MQPLSPQERAAIKTKHPDVTDTDIDEYERLLGQHFNADPNEPAADKQKRHDRIQELNAKLFPERTSVRS